MEAYRFINILPQFEDNNSERFEVFSSSAFKTKLMLVFFFDHKEPN